MLRVVYRLSKGFPFTTTYGTSVRDRFNTNSSLGLADIGANFGGFSISLESSIDTPWQSARIHHRALHHRAIPYGTVSNFGLLAAKTTIALLVDNTMVLLVRAWETQSHSNKNLPRIWREAVLSLVAHHSHLKIISLTTGRFCLHAETIQPETISLVRLVEPGWSRGEQMVGNQVVESLSLRSSFPLLSGTG